MNWNTIDRKLYNECCVTLNQELDRKLDRIMKNAYKIMIFERANNITKAHLFAAAIFRKL